MNLDCLFQQINRNQQQGQERKMPNQPIQQKRKTRSVSTFLKKTYEILEDVENNYAIKWATSGVGFIVVKQQQFSKEILPKYFKHSNYSSFVRQLNMYNFHKIREANHESHFHHQCFKRNNKALLSQIKRKPEKKKRRNQEDSEDPDNDQYNEKSDVSMKNMIKNKQNSNSKLQYGQVNIKSYKSNGQKRNFQNTHHIFGSERQDRHGFDPLSEDFCQRRNQKSRRNGELSQSKQRVSIQNILMNSSQNEDQRLSINNQIAEQFPRYPTKQIFYPSSNNIYPFPTNFKGGINPISHLNIFF